MNSFIIRNIFLATVGILATLCLSNAYQLRGTKLNNTNLQDFKYSPPLIADNLNGQVQNYVAENALYLDPSYYANNVKLYDQQNFNTIHNQIGFAQTDSFTSPHKTKRDIRENELRLQRELGCKALISFTKRCEKMAHDASDILTNFPKDIKLQEIYSKKMRYLYNRLLFNNKRFHRDLNNFSDCFVLNFCGNVRLILGNLKMISLSADTLIKELEKDNLNKWEKNSIAYAKRIVQLAEQIILDIFTEITNCTQESNKYRPADSLIDINPLNPLHNSAYESVRSPTANSDTTDAYYN